ncbi:twin-arginine translocase subunit TatC [Staphylococcus debuckii]|nr:twin-arginine translocase subunit TatC [Staphylococcus debuckii]
MESESYATQTSSYTSSLLGHFGELRSRLLKAGIAFIVAVLIMYISSHWWMHPFIHEIKRGNMTLHAFSFTEMIQIYVMIIFFGALLLVSPIIFYQLWAFIAPGLHANERGFIRRYSAFCAFFFLAGIAFAYFIGFPLIIHFSLNLSGIMDIAPVIGFKEYLSELLRWLLIFGILFQLPVVLFGLARFGLIDAHQLSKSRKYVYFACFVGASIVAPPDLLLNILLTIPLILLFEVSMVIVKVTQLRHPQTFPEK